MGKLVVSEFITVDGVFEDPGGSEGLDYGGWAFQFDRGQEGDKFKLDEVMEAEALLLGHVTYDGFAQAWPGRTDEMGFADKFNSMPKYVVSNSLENPEWNNSTVIAGGDLAARVGELKHELQGDLLVNGSGRLVRQLTDEQLVDEYRLMVFPTVVGRGKRLFDGISAPSSLRLRESQAAGETLILIYEPGRR